MKQSLTTIAILCIASLCYPAAAQLMRLAILPQPTIKITAAMQPVLVSVGLDYYRMEPNAANVPNQPVYNQVYSPADVVVKINSKLSHKTFQELVEGDNALLLLQPLSKERIHAEINTKNPESRGVESIELDFLGHVEVGYNKSDADVKQAMILFKNYGVQQSATTYLDRAMCMDIMQQNKKLIYDENFVMQPASLQLLNNLFNRLDFTLFAPKDMKTFINAGFITINDSGALTSSSINALQQVFYYQQSIAATQPINTAWKTKNYTECKTAFYNESYTLAKFDDRGTMDSIVNGIRYVHMMAWKAKGFTEPADGKPYIVKRGDSVFYRSSAGFFANAFFMVQAGELQQWLGSHHLNTNNMPESRLRLMQLLGLPPGSGNDLFVDFWIKRSDMFRPGIDSSLSLSGVLTTLDSGYIKSFLGYSTGSFSAPVLLSKYPFTGLGYTWDWYPENKSHVGLNEFVIKDAREVYMGKTYSTEEYLKRFQ